MKIKLPKIEFYEVKLPRPKLPKLEFSKIIVTIAGITVMRVTEFTLDMVRETKNLEPLFYLIPAIFTVLTTAVGFYYSKAKLENGIKLRKKYGREIYNDVKGENINE